LSQLEDRSDQLPLPVFEYIQKGAAVVREVFERVVLPANVIPA